jgi:mRNA-degrading endonuclease RelE of RelBE toxin-antitoxin system
MNWLMNFEVAPEFEKALKRLSKKYPSLKTDYLAFLQELEQNPTMGDEIFPHCRKARIAIKSKGKGKSGGGRIIFYFEVVQDKITLLFIYDKSEMENVQTAFIEQILQAMLPFINGRN